MARTLQFASAGWARLALLPAMIFVNSALLAAQDDSIYRLPAGTRIKLKMDVELSSKMTSVGDTFTATVAKPVHTRNVIVLPVGTVFEGRVASAEHAGLAGNSGKLEIVFEKFWLSGETTRSIDGALVNRLGSQSSQTRNVLTIIGGTIIGAVFGGLTKSTSGALVGAGIGAGGGTAVAMLRKGKDVRIAKGEEFEIVLRKEVVLPVLDY